MIEGVINQQETEAFEGMINSYLVEFEYEIFTQIKN